jgi:hypothetical protein
VTKTLALELDLGPTFVKGDYASFSLVPGVVWAFSPHAYFALRCAVAVDPESAVYAAPGVGLSHTFGNTHADAGGELLAASATASRPGCDRDPGVFTRFNGAGVDDDWPPQFRKSAGPTGFEENDA